MTPQDMLDWFTTGFTFLLGGLIKTLWGDSRELKDKIAELKLSVSENYVKKEELARLTDAIFEKLDRIENKLDQKMDKGRS